MRTLKFAFLTKLFVIMTVLLAAFALGRDGASSRWNEYSFPDDNFAIRSPQQPKQWKVINGLAYGFYFDQETRAVLNLLVERGQSCSDWLGWAQRTFGHSEETSTLKNKYSNSRSIYPVSSNGKLIKVNGNTAVESSTPRNAMQSGYQLSECSGERAYHFEAGWPKDGEKPAVVDQIIQSFRILEPKR